MKGRPGWSVGLETGRACGVLVLMLLSAPAPRHAVGTAQQTTGMRRTCGGFIGVLKLELNLKLCAQT